MTKQQRPRYSGEPKAEVLKMGENTNVTRQPGHESQTHSWRFAMRKKARSSNNEAALIPENSQLKRHLSEQTEELAIL